MDMEITTLVSLTREYSKKVKKKRTPSDIFIALTSEIGELADELSIESGFSYKQPGTDGVIGEALDCILCLIDLIHIRDPNITEEQLMEMALLKLEKWKKLTDFQDKNK